MKTRSAHYTKAKTTVCYTAWGTGLQGDLRKELSHLREIESDVRKPAFFLHYIYLAFLICIVSKQSVRKWNKHDKMGVS